LKRFDFLELILFKKPLSKTFNSEIICGGYSYELNKKVFQKWIL